MRLFSILLYTFSLANAFNSCLMLHSYLRKVKDEDKQEEYPAYMNFDFWKVFIITVH